MSCSIGRCLDANFISAASWTSRRRRCREKSAGASGQQIPHTEKVPGMREQPRTRRFRQRHSGTGAMGHGSHQLQASPVGGGRGGGDARGAAAEAAGGLPTNRPMESDFTMFFITCESEVTWGRCTSEREAPAWPPLRPSHPALHPCLRRSLSQRELQPAVPLSAALTQYHR